MRRWGGKSNMQNVIICFEVLFSGELVLFLAHPWSSVGYVLFRGNNLLWFWIKDYAEVVQVSIFSSFTRKKENKRRGNIVLWNVWIWKGKGKWLISHVRAERAGRVQPGGCWWWAWRDSWGYKRMEPGPGQDKRHWAHTGTQEAPFTHQEPLAWAVDRAGISKAAWVCSRGCGSRWPCWNRAVPADQHPVPVQNTAHTLFNAKT